MEKVNGLKAERFSQLNQMHGVQVQKKVSGAVQ